MNTTSDVQNLYLTIMQQSQFPQKSMQLSQRLDEILLEKATSLDLFCLYGVGIPKYNRYTANHIVSDRYDIPVNRLFVPEKYLLRTNQRVHASSTERRSSCKSSTVDYDGVIIDKIP